MRNEKFWDPFPGKAWRHALLSFSLKYINILARNTDIWISQYWYHYPWHLPMEAPLLLPASPSLTSEKGKRCRWKRTMEIICLLVLTYLSCHIRGHLTIQEHGAKTRAPTHSSSIEDKNSVLHSTADWPVKTSRALQMECNTILCKSCVI